MTPRSRCTPPTMNFSEDVKYYLKILYYEYFPQHHAKKNEESGEAQRERYALMRSRCSEVPHKMSFREDVAARYSRKISYFRAVLAPTHNTREKKKERNLFLFCRHFFISRAFIALGFPSLLTPRVRVGGCLPLFVRSRCARQHIRDFCFVSIRESERKAPTTRRGKRVQDVEDQDHKRWATRFRAR